MDTLTPYASFGRCVTPIGDLDAMVVNHANAANLVYLNNGTGTFTDSGQRLGSDQSIWVDLGYPARIGPDGKSRFP